MHFLITRIENLRYSALSKASMNVVLKRRARTVLLFVTTVGRQVLPRNMNLHPGLGSRYYFSDNATTGQQVYFLLTRSGYEGQTAKKLKIGSPKTAVDQAYPAPVRILETPEGEIRVHRSIILLLDQDGSLRRRVLYGQEG